MKDFKLGDRVRVLPRKDGQREQKPFYLDRMRQFENRLFNVEKIHYNGEISLCGLSYYRWNPEWLELVRRESSGLTLTPESGSGIKGGGDLGSLFIDEKISDLWHSDIEDTKQLPYKVVFNYAKKRTTLMFNGGGVIRTDTHKTDTYDVWFGFLIGIVKRLSDDKVKYKRFIEQLYSYPKMRRESALEFYVYNLLSDTLSNHQFNKLKDRIKNTKNSNEVIKFKDFELEVITKGLWSF